MRNLILNYFTNGRMRTYIGGVMNQEQIMSGVRHGMFWVLFSVYLIPTEASTQHLPMPLSCYAKEKQKNPKKNISYYAEVQTITTNMNYIKKLEI